MTERRRIVLLLAAILLAAVVARLWALDGPALWWDEGNNAYFAHQSPAQVLEVSRATHDTDPPAHRLALGLWLRLLGDSAFNLRLLSVLLGLVTVWLVYLWGEWLGGPAVGLSAALLTALTPMAVYYSREAKGYPFVAAFGLAATYLWARYLAGGERRPWLWPIYVLCQAAAVGAHYYAVLLIVAQGVWLAADLLRGWRRQRPRPGEEASPPAMRRIASWVLAQFATGALVFPWAWLTMSASLEGAMNVPHEGGAMGLFAYLREILLSFAAGPRAVSASGVLPWLAALAACALCAAAVLALHSRRSAKEGLLLCFFLVPVALGFVVQRRYSFFSARFVLYALPPLYLLAAAGLARARVGGLVLGGALLAIWAYAMPTTYAPFVGPEEDLRPAARLLSALARPGDAVVSSYIWEEGILRMYAPHADVSYHLGWFGKKNVEQQMVELLAEHPRLWLVTYGAPLQHSQNRGGWWLEQHAPRAALVENGPHRLVLYLAPCAEDTGQNASFEAGIRLAYKPVAEQVATGQPVSLALHWQLDRPLTDGQRVTVMVHLYDASGKLWAQNDGDPVNGLRAFAAMVPGQPVSDCRALLTPADIPPGHYRLVVGLYRPATGDRLAVLEGADAGRDVVTIGEVEITP